MKHLYQNDDGVYVAADAPEDAAKVYAERRKSEPEEWEQMPDDEFVEFLTNNDVYISKRARAWADDFSAPFVVQPDWA